MRRFAFLWSLLLACACVSPAQAQRAWQAPVPANLTVDLMQPAVTAHGELLLSWAERRPDGHGTLLRVLAGSTAVSLAQNLTSWRWQLATARDGSTLAAWTEAVGAEYRVFAALRPPGGAFEPPVDLGPGDGANVASNPQGDYVVVFGSGGELQAAHRPAGRAFLPPAPLGVPASGAAVALTHEREVIAAWTRSGGLGQEKHTLMVSSSTSPVPVALTGAQEDLPGPSLAVDAHGRAIVGWGEREAGAANGAVRAATRSADGAWSAPVTLDDGVRARPTLATGDDGDVVAAWNAFVASDASGSGAIGPLRVATGRIDGGGFSPPHSYSNSSLPPGLAVNPDGTALVTYGDYYEIHTVRRQGTAPFGPLQTAVCPRPAATPVLAGLDAVGNATILYRDGNAPANPWQIVRDAPAAEPSPAGCRIGPVMPPGPRRAPDVIVSSIKVARGQRLGAVLRRGLRVTTDVNADGPSSAVGLYLNGRRLAVARYRQVAGVPVTHALRIPKASARKLRRARRVRLKLVLTRGGAALKTASVTLRR